MRKLLTVYYTSIFYIMSMIFLVLFVLNISTLIVGFDTTFSIKYLGRIENYLKKNNDYIY